MTTIVTRAGKGSALTHAEVDANFTNLNNAKLEGTVAVANGGTGATDAATARTNLGAAASGANSDITSLTGLSTALSITQGGTGATTAANARTSLGVAIGSNVQAYSSNLDAFALKTAPAGTVVGTSDTQTLTNKTLTAPAVSGGSIDNATVGATTPNSGSFTTLAASGTVTFTSTGAMKIQVGTTAQRPTAATGMLRFNSDLGKFEGYNGSAWSSVGGGATGGGSDAIFIENGQTVTTNYTLSTGTNAGSFGPISIASGVTVTVPSGQVWTIV